MKKTLLFSFIFCFANATCLAQSTFAIGGSYSMATGNLEEATPGLASVIMAAEMIVQLKDSPFHLGGSIGFGGHLNQDADSFAPEVGDRFYRDGNNLSQINAILRYKPRVRGDFRPYLDIHTGITQVTGVTTMYKMEEDGECRISTEKEFRSRSMGIGLGAGVEVYYGEDELMVTLGVSTTQGTRVNYKAPGATVLTDESPFPGRNIQNAQLSFLTFHAGFKSYIFRKKRSKK